MEDGDCPDCAGIGYIQCSRWRDHIATGGFHEDYSCDECKRLHEDSRPCPVCGSTGKLPAPRVPVPPLTEEQQQPTSLCYGGHLRDIPEPHRRRWPGYTEPRVVATRIICYYGIGIHYNASVEAANNPLWDSVGKIWRVAWDDHDAEGPQLRAKFDRLDQATAWLKYIIPRYFDLDEIEVTGDMEYEGGVFTYPREGD